MKYRFYLFLFLLILSSCKKEGDNNPPVNGGSPDADPVQYGIPFDGVPETNEIIMYEINLRAYSPTGDIQGIINRIDSIQALGINVIWLMPIHPVGELNSVNSPYCVMDYKKVNPEFGTLDDLRDLVEAAHEREMAVIIDWVANHTAWDNPWIYNTDWYTQVDGEIVSPPGTNWLDVADLDYNSADMRMAMIKAMKYWVLTANIDGYRCDAADFIPFDFWQQALDTLLSIPDRKLILLAEGSRTDHFTAGFQMTYAWDFYSQMQRVYTGQPASSLFTVHYSEYNAVPDGKHKLRYTTNHDESAWNATPMTLFNGKEGALAASAITICMGGVPLLYAGQEIGQSSLVPIFNTSTINWTKNPDMLNAYKLLLNFHKQSEALNDGTLQTFPDDDIAAFKRIAPDEEVLVLANIRNSVTNYSLPAELQNSSWKNALTNTSVSLATELGMEAYEFLVLVEE